MAYAQGDIKPFQIARFFILLFVLSYKLISFFLFLYYKCLLVFTLNTLKNFVQTYEL